MKILMIAAVATGLLGYTAQTSPGQWERTVPSPPAQCWAEPFGSTGFPKPAEAGVKQAGIEPMYLIARC